jgi:hypothetical protein
MPSRRLCSAITASKMCRDLSWVGCVPPAILPFLPPRFFPEPPTCVSIAFSVEDPARRSSVLREKMWNTGVLNKACSLA